MALTALQCQIVTAAFLTAPDEFGCAPGLGRVTAARNLFPAELIAKSKSVTPDCPPLCVTRTVMTAADPTSDQRPMHEGIVRDTRETLPLAEDFGTNRLARVKERLRSVRLLRMRGSRAVRQQRAVPAESSDCAGEA